MSNEGINSDEVTEGQNRGTEYGSRNDVRMNEANEDESEEDIFTWHNKPKEGTFTDWTIILKNSNDSVTTKTYHVHQVVLAAGSEYFNRVFLTRMQVQEKEDKTSKITVDSEEEMEAFPIMLDNLYCRHPLGAPLQGVTTKNASVIRKLANYFQCCKLRKELSAFVSYDLSLETACDYLEKAFAFNDIETVNHTTMYIVDNFGHFQVSEPFMCLSIEPFASVCGRLAALYHPRASAFIRQYFEANPEAISVSSVRTLTCRLTKVHRLSAEGLLGLIGQLDLKDEDQDSLRDINNLTKMCADTVGRDWEQLDQENVLNEFKSPSIHHACTLVAIHHLSSAFTALKGEVDQLRADNLVLRGRNAKLEEANDKLNERKKRKGDV